VSDPHGLAAGDAGRDVSVEEQVPGVFELGFGAWFGVVPGVEVQASAPAKGCDRDQVQGIFRYDDRREEVDFLVGVGEPQGGAPSVIHREGGGDAVDIGQG